MILRYSINTFMVWILFSITPFIHAQVIWEKIADEKITGHIYSFEIDSANKIYAASKYGLFVFSNKGTSWDKLYSPINSSEHVLSVNLISDNEILIGTTDGVLKSTDKGLTWSDNYLVSRFTNLLVSDQFGNIYSGSQPIYKSEDGGDTWKLFNNDFFVWSIYTFSKDNIMFGTDCGVYLSNDNGISWELTGYFTCGDVTAINALEKENKIYIGGSDRFHGVYYSQDGGYNWQYIMNSDTIRSITSIIPTDKKVFFSSRNNGVFSINTSGDNLNNFSNGLKYGVTSMVLDSLGYLYASSVGIYKTTYPVDSAKFLRNSVYNFSLNQNYPNPFNSTTRITYNLRAECNVVLKVYNINGERVAQITKGVQPKGNYSIIINANSLSSGVYFYQLITDSFSETKKMLLIK